MEDMKLQSKLLRVALVHLPARVAVALSVILISAAPSLGEQPARQNPPERGTQVMPLTAKLTVENKVGKNDMIRKFGEWLVEQGRDRKAPVIDFNTLMLKINAECQKVDPAFSVIGPDRIHPDVRGHTVMTYSFARAQHIEGPVACVEIDAATGSTKAVNATAEELKKAHDELSFINKPKPQRVELRHVAGSIQ
jgi:hypothetical protein